MAQTVLTHRPLACVVIIGDEILSGRTQDQNLQYIARGLAQRGIVLCETRVLRDEVSTIANTLQDLMRRFQIIITTGGLGSTHDDVTIEAVSHAVQKPLVYQPEAWHMMERHYGSDLDPLYKGMAYLPQDSTLIANTVTGAPGFSILSIHVLAGVPRIMRAMFDALLPTLPQGDPWYTQTLVCHVEEGLIAHDLENLQKLYPDVQIGSYPIDLQNGSYRLNLVLKADEDDRLKKAIRACCDLIHRHGDTPEIILD